MPAPAFFAGILPTGDGDMHRREFLQSGAALTPVAALRRGVFPDPPSTPRRDVGRKFEVPPRIEIASARGRAQAWVPLPAVTEPDWMHPLGNRWTTNAQSAQL